MTRRLRFPLSAFFLSTLACAPAPAPERPPMATNPAETETATLGGGCFWCIEAVFERVEGIVDAESGYAGGHTPNPTYDEVSSGATGHAEVVRLTFDPQAIRYREILEIFFSMHDPTTPDRQGADVGSQYRSLILFHSPAQQEVAEGLVRELAAEGVFDAPIVTEIAPFEGFTPAEISHQDYYARNPDKGYCRVVISPKLEKLKQTFKAKLRRE